MEQPVKEKRTQKFGEYQGPRGVRYIARQRPSDIGYDLQAKETARQHIFGPLLVPLHMPKDMSDLNAGIAHQAKIKMADHAMRMFQINPAGFRQTSKNYGKRGNRISFVERRFIDAGMLSA